MITRRSFLGRVLGTTIAAAAIPLKIDPVRRDGFWLALRNQAGQLIGRQPLTTLEAADVTWSCVPPGITIDAVVALDRHDRVVGATLVPPVIPNGGDITVQFGEGVIHFE